MNRVKALLPAAAVIARDLAGLAGIGLIVAGIERWSEPAAMIAAGCTLIALAAGLARQ